MWKAGKGVSHAGLACQGRMGCDEQRTAEARTANERKSEETDFAVFIGRLDCRI